MYKHCLIRFSSGKSTGLVPVCRFSRYSVCFSSYSRPQCDPTPCTVVFILLATSVTARGLVGCLPDSSFVRFENFLPCPSSIAAFSCHITSASFLKIILFSYDSFCRCKNEAKTAQIFERQISRFLSRCSLNPLFLSSLIAHSFSLNPVARKAATATSQQTDLER